MTRRAFETMTCDRCKHEAAIPVDEAYRNWQTVGFPHVSGGFIGCGIMPPTFDLCPDCRGELITWWEYKYPFGGKA
jgi:hypothetical protein